MFDFYERVERKQDSRKNHELTITLTFELDLLSISRVGVFTQFVHNMTKNVSNNILAHWERSQSKY
jgi:hypothetical protein